ncbi:UDP glycosyltransferase 8 [Rhizophlyctis rosea]|nr:UDP glycosyltransferase 8 [Rhizophlyctis rosea]
MTPRPLLSWIYLIAFIPWAATLKVALSAIPYRGHYMPLLSLAETLHDRGHETYFVGPEPARYMVAPHGNVTFWSVGEFAQYEEHKRYANNQFAQRSIIVVMKRVFDIFLETYEALLPRTAAAFAEINPDIVICDGVSAFCIQAARMEGVRLVILWPAATSGVPESPGSLLPSSVVPVIGAGGVMDGTFGSRVKQFVVSVFHKGIAKYVDAGIKGINRRLGVEDLVRSRTDLLDEVVISWTAFGLDYAQVVPPLFKTVGYMVREPVPALSEEYTEFIGPSENVVLVSFGSVVVITAPDFEYIQSILQNATATDPTLKIIWSVNAAQSALLPPDLDPFSQQGSTTPDMTRSTAGKFLYTRWAPQRSLLAHPSTTLFISHAGGNGIHEALYFGKPILGIPIAGDTPDNCARMQRTGAGECVPIPDVISNRTADILTRMLNPESRQPYIRAAQRVRRIFKDAGGVDKAAEWVEWRAEQETLEPWSVRKFAEVPWWKYYYLDVLGAVGGTLHLVAWIVWRMLWWVWRVGRGEKSRGRDVYTGKVGVGGQGLDGKDKKDLWRQKEE